MKKLLVAMGLVAFAVVGCDDSSSASTGSNDEPGVESSSSSSGKAGEPAEVTSSSSEKAKSSSSDTQSDVKQSSSSEKTGKSSSSTDDASSSSVKSESSSSVEDLQSSSSSSADEMESSSSSETLATPCKTETEDNCEYGELTDDRDGRTYKTVKIGDQVWMAENLNYAYTGVPFDNGFYTSDSTSWCYDNDPTNCAKYGRLYTWAAAMDSVGEWSTNGKGCGNGKECSPTSPVRGICPKGWHLPSIDEWDVLFTAVGGSSTAGTKLKSATGWYGDGIGTDAFGFSALPAGNRDNRENYGNYDDEGGHAYFWSSTEYTEYGSNHAYYVILVYSFNSALLYSTLKDIFGFSVRCLKD